MFTGGSDDEAVCIRAAKVLAAQAGTDKSTSKGCAKAQVDMSTTARPHENIQKNFKAASVPARGGYSAISIQDYTRISNERSEFLNFLLAPNPSGIPASDYGVLKAA